MVRRNKKFWLSAWVLSKRPGYRYLVMTESDTRITDCDVFVRQSLIAAIRESHAAKRWIGGNCSFGGGDFAGEHKGTCGLQLASAASVARDETELSSLVSSGATCTYTRYTIFHGTKLSPSPRC